MCYIRTCTKGVVKLITVKGEDALIRGTPSVLSVITITCSSRKPIATRNVNVSYFTYQVAKHFIVCLYL
jgi:hypothetical protein